MFNYFFGFWFDLGAHALACRGFGVKVKFYIIVINSLIQNEELHTNPAG